MPEHDLLAHRGNVDDVFPVNGRQFSELRPTSDEAVPADVQPVTGSAEAVPSEPPAPQVVSFEPSVEDAREAAYQHHVETHINYFQKIRDDGDLPWFEDPAKLTKLEGRFPGISKTPGEPARRRFFFARYGVNEVVASEQPASLAADGMDA